MFSSGQLLSSLNPGILHSPATQFFPAFPSRLGHPQLLIPAPLLSYELLRTYLQPEPCKQALLLSSQASSIVRLPSDTGKSNQNCWVYQVPSTCSVKTVLIIGMKYLSISIFLQENVFQMTICCLLASVAAKEIDCVAYLGNIF